ncbi:MAG: sugar transferase [Candidatus Nanopelagicales bacterium]|nr:sugar transferase [Candidatus Nanopelagicales bacterium]
MTQRLSTRQPRVSTRNEFLRDYQLRVRALDVAVILTAVVIGLLLGWGYGGEFFSDDRPRQLFSVALLVIWPIALWQAQSTKATIVANGLGEYRRVIVATVWTGLLVMSLAYLTNTDYGRWFLVGVMLTGLLLLLIERNLMRRWLHRRMAEGQPLHRVFLIAPPSRMAKLQDDLAGSQGRFVTVGCLALDEDWNPSSAVDAALASKADTLLFAPGGDMDPQQTRRLGWAMEDTDLSLMVSASLVEVAGPRLSVEPVEALSFVRVDMPKFSGTAVVLKAITDVIGSSLLLILLGLPMLLIAFLVRRGSEGPAIFKQERVGLDGRTFQCWKFRTMYVDADARREELRAAHGDGGATFKMADDPRVTRIGRFLRRFSMDELPQLINVWRGDMSLVGPRPHPRDDVERYDDLAVRRLRARPGMTGLWQVRGRSDLSWEESVRLDLYYVENWSLSMDFVIMASTVSAVVGGRGAY